MIHSLQVSGKIQTSRKVSLLSYLEGSAKNSSLLEGADLEAKSIFFFAVILLLQNLNCFSMSIRLHQEVFILRVRVVQLLVSLFISQRIPKQKRLFWNLEHSFSQTEVFAVLMNSTRWTITQETFYMKRWSSKLFLLPRLVSFVL